MRSKILFDITYKNCLQGLICITLVYLHKVGIRGLDLGLRGLSDTHRHTCAIELPQSEGKPLVNGVTESHGHLFRKPPFHVRLH